MTAVPKNPRVSELRELFRHLNAFRAVFADHGMEDISTPDGNTWSIWDLEYLCDQLPRLRERQQQAIVMCLIHNMRERDAAVAMGVSPTNPVMMYATLGLQRLLDMIDAGELTRYREQQLAPYHSVALHVERERRIVNHIRSICQRDRNGCLLYPHPGTGQPKLLLCTRRTPSGFQVLSPARVLFENVYGPLAPGSTPVHTETIPGPRGASCIEPSHQNLSVEVGGKTYVIKNEIEERQPA